MLSGLIILDVNKPKSSKSSHKVNLCSSPAIRRQYTTSSRSTHTSVHQHQASSRSRLASDPKAAVSCLEASVIPFVVAAAASVREVYRVRHVPWFI